MKQTESVFRSCY